MSSPEALLYQELTEDEAALLDLDRRALYTMNATAKRIFERAREGADIDAILEELGREFELPPSCREDVERFVDELRREGLLPSDAQR